MSSAAWYPVQDVPGWHAAWTVGCPVCSEPAGAGCTDGYARQHMRVHAARVAAGELAVMEGRNAHAVRLERRLPFGVDLEEQRVTRAQLAEAMGVDDTEPQLAPGPPDAPAVLYVTSGGERLQLDRGEGALELDVRERALATALLRVALDHLEGFE